MVHSMKFVIAIVNPLKLDAVVDTLKRAGVQDMTVADVRDYGRKGWTEIYRGAQFTANFLPMLRIEAAVAGDQVEGVTAAVAAAADTGRSDDFRIFVLDLEDATRIRTGEPGGMAPRRAA
jgi:nitrogen regulatory protein P-II 2